MKTHTYTFFQIKQLVRKISLIIGLTAFSYVAVAGSHITDAQILRAAKIARDTGTTITITKETTTVKVSGNNKKAAKKFKKSVIKLPKQKKSKWTKSKPLTWRRAVPRRAPILAPTLENSPPRLENAPTTQNNQGAGAGTLRTPVLETVDTTGFY
jgi:hypothetical protein